MWMDLENILLSERSHKRPYVVWFHLHEMITIGKSRDRKISHSLLGAGCVGEMGSDC